MMMTMTLQCKKAVCSFTCSISLPDHEQPVLLVYVTERSQNTP